MGSVVKMLLKGEVGGRTLNSHGNYISVAAFLIYAQCGEDAAKGRLEAVHEIVMEITLLIMENHGKIMVLCF